MSYTHMSIVNSLMVDTIPTIVENIRMELSMKYDVTSGECEKFAGLCDVASTEVILRLKDHLINNGFTTPEDFIIKSVHGEQRHSMIIESKYWPLQHTWVYLNIFNTAIYIDPTSSQFDNFYNDIPSYYISTVKPKWYYPDQENPSWRGISCKINNVKFIPRKISIDGEPFIAHDGIIDFIQYEIWGRISDIIRRIKRKIDRGRD